VPSRLSRRNDPDQRVKRHVVECKRVLWELNLERIGATVTISQSRRRSSVAIFGVKQFEYTLFQGILLLANLLTMFLLIAPFPSNILVCVRLNR
jgi:hypothetical protein